MVTVIATSQSEHEASGLPLLQLALHCSAHRARNIAERAVDAWLATFDFLANHWRRALSERMLSLLVVEPCMVTLRQYTRRAEDGDDVVYAGAMSASLDDLLGYRERAIDLFDDAMPLLGVSNLMSMLLAHASTSTLALEASLDALARLCGGGATPDALAADDAHAALVELLHRRNRCCRAATTD